MIPFDATGAFRPESEGSELRRLAVRGAGAAVSARAVNLLVQVGTTVVLARLVAPADFGVVAMVTTFSLLLVSFGLNGFTEAIMQCKEIEHYTASNLFWLNLAGGLVLSIAFAVSGALLSALFRNPLVAKAAVGMSLSIFISAASVIHLALLKRGMCFAATSANEVIARIAYGVVAILLAWRGWGYWALVAGYIAYALSLTIGAWWLCRWIPSLPRRTGRTGPLVRFAISVYGRFIVVYGSQNMDNLLVGWKFNAVALGFYKKAYDLFALSASQLVAPLHTVALAALSRLNAEPTRFRRYLIKSLGIVAFVGMAVGADLTLIGRDVVRFLLGPQWGEAGTIFAFFGPGIGIMLLNSTAGWIHLSIGKPERWLRWTIFEFAVTVLLFFLALRWGPKGIAVAWSASFWILTIPAFWYAGRPIGFGVSSLIAAVWRYTAASLLAGLTTAAIIRSTPLWGAPPDAKVALQAIVIISGLFLALYLGTVTMLHWGLAPLRQLGSLLRELAPGRTAAGPITELVSERGSA